MKRTAAAISSGLVPRFSKVRRGQFLELLVRMRTLGSAGPGAIALTRIRGASACAMVCVTTHKPPLLAV